MSASDGSTADYYELPAGATELQDLISHRNLNAQDGEIFRAIYRKGRASHSDELRDARKVLFYAQAEVKRLEKLATVKESLTAHPVHPATFDHIDPADVEIASAIEDDSERMQAIGQNGEMASEVYAAVYGVPSWEKAPEKAMWLAQDENGRWFWYGVMPEIDGDQWNFTGGDFYERDYSIPALENKNWRTTLQARPAN